MGKGKAAVWLYFCMKQIYLMLLIGSFLLNKIKKKTQTAFLLIFFNQILPVTVKSHWFAFFSERFSCDLGFPVCVSIILTYSVEFCLIAHHNSLNMTYFNFLQRSFHFLLFYFCNFFFFNILIIILCHSLYLSDCVITASCHLVCFIPVFISENTNLT